VPATAFGALPPPSPPQAAKASAEASNAMRGADLLAAAIARLPGPSAQDSNHDAGTRTTSSWRSPSSTSAKPGSTEAPSSCQEAASPGSMRI
jgi:hypothetical protein